MISVSDEFYNLMQVRTNFLEYATVILQDNTEFNLTPADFTITNNSITDGAGSNALPLGVAVEKLVQIEIANPDEKYNEYDFYGAIVELQIRFQLSNSVETLTRGTYTVIQPAHYGDTIIITAADDMYKADRLFSADELEDIIGITVDELFPATLEDLAYVVSTITEINLASQTFTNSTLTINSFSGDITQYTYRQLFGFIAQLAGGNARINYNNELEFITYNKSKINSMVDSTAGDVITVSTDFPLALTFDEDPSTFQDMSILLIDSANTNVYSWSWNTLQTYINDHTITLPTNATIQAVRNVPCILEVKWLSLYDGVWHSYRMLMPDINREIVGIEVLDKWNNLTVETDNIEITGIKTTLSAEQLDENNPNDSDTVLVGTDEYSLEITNPLLNYNNVSTILANVGNKLIGLKLRPFSGDHVSNPIIEFMDPVFVVNKRGRTYASIITDIQFNVLGYTTISNSAEPKLRNGQVYPSKASDVLLKAIESSDKKVRAINNYFWHDLAGAHVSTVENDATTGPNVLIDSDSLDIRNGTDVRASFSASGMDIFSDNGTEIAHLGYANGTNQSGGTSVAPYTTLGKRASGTIGNYSTAEGYQNLASGYSSHAEGGLCTASGLGAHAEGGECIASGSMAHAEGSNTTASGEYAHAEGCGARASGDASHAEGGGQAVANYSHAEAYATARGFGSHAEGQGTTGASAGSAHAEGTGTANGTNSHAEGSSTTATGTASHAGGVGTIAGYQGQTAIGNYNSNQSTNIFEVGNGTSSTRSNAFAVDSSGNIHVNGNVYVGCNDDSSGGTRLVEQEATTTWTTPTIVSSAVSSVTGGYYTEGKRVYIQLRCVLATALSADATRDIFSDLPKPKSVTEIALNCLVRSRAGNTARLYAASSDTTAKIMLIADPDHAISAGQNIAIAGVYTIN